MKLLLDNETSVYDVSNRVGSIDPIHESLGDGDGFVVPELSFKLDNSDGWVTEEFIPNIRAERVWVTLQTSHFTVFSGYLKQKDPTLTGRFESVASFQVFHVSEVMREQRIAYGFSDPHLLPIVGIFTNLGRWQYPVNWATGGIRIGGHDVDFREYRILRNYFLESKSGLQVMGDLCRIFGAAPMWSNNRMWLRSIQESMGSTATEISPIGESEQEPVYKKNGVSITGSNSTHSFEALSENAIKDDKGTVSWNLDILAHLDHPVLRHNYNATVARYGCESWMKLWGNDGYQKTVWIEEGWDLYPGRKVTYSGNNFLIMESFKHVFFERKFKTQLVLRKI